MTWSDRYVGIPEVDFGRDRSGCDCWGLARLVYEHELQIILPSYDGDYASPEETAEVSALIEGAERSATWRRIEGPADRCAFDMMVFATGPFRSHLGVAAVNGLMLHMEGSARLEDPFAGRWGKRLAGVYRHVKSPFNGAFK